jgi:hypothetical protein
MRDTDDDETNAAARHNELRDIHHRIDALKEENERQYGSLIERLHALEVAIATGNRFPAAAWVAAAGLFLTVLGIGFVTYHKLETSQANGIKAIQLIERHMEGSGERFAAIRDANAVTQEWERKLPALEGRVRNLEERIVGQGPNGWHRQDHELYAKMMDERNERIKIRLDVIEKNQTALCERVRECKGGQR